MAERHPAALIQKRLLSQAKRALFNSSMMVTEPARNPGFGEPQFAFSQRRLVPSDSSRQLTGFASRARRAAIASRRSSAPP